MNLSMREDIKCHICQKTYSNYKGLSSHIRQAHNMKSKEYYDNFLKEENEGICPECGKETTFNKLSIGYRIFCSSYCASHSLFTINKIKTALLNNSKFIQQARKTIIAYNQSNKGRKTSSRIGKITGGANLRDAHTKYDTIKFCPTCNKETKHIIGQGCAACWSKKATELSKIAIRTKYNVDNVFQLDDVKNKIKQTSLERYGISNPGNNREARIKAARTRYGNGNNSSWEDLLEIALCTLHINYIKQYMDNKRYPYLCDFYLPEIDTFIEINGYWSHGGHFFDKNNPEDIILLNKWKEKAKNGHKQYQNAINVWTVKDLTKLQAAQKNNLNYVVLWTYTDILSYIEYLTQLCKDVNT